MRILVDADACPVKQILERVAQEKNLKMILLCDTNHFIESDYGEVQIVSPGTDAVDFALINICCNNDCVVTQDHGVAAMALGRGAYAIHPSGEWYTDENIDRMLMERFIAQEVRRSSKYQFRGAKIFGGKQQKRTNQDNIRFEQSFRKLLRHIQYLEDNQKK